MSAMTTLRAPAEARPAAAAPACPDCPRCPQCPARPLVLQPFADGPEVIGTCEGCGSIYEVHRDGGAWVPGDRVGMMSRSYRTARAARAAPSPGPPA